jgi:hypothetical protein
LRKRRTVPCSVYVFAPSLRCGVDSVTNRSLGGVLVYPVDGDSQRRWPAVLNPATLLCVRKLRAYLSWHYFGAPC